MGFPDLPVAIGVSVRLGSGTSLYIGSCIVFIIVYLLMNRPGV